MKIFKQPSGEFSAYDPNTEKTTPDTSTPLKAAVISFENRIRIDAQQEHSAFFDEQGNILLSRDGLPDRVGYSHAESLRMKGVTFAHNHPRGASFSFEDIVLACQYGFGEMRAVTETFRHSMRGNWPSVVELRKVYDEEFAKAERVAHDRIITGELRIPFYGYEIRHLTWVGAANRLQLLYKREKS